MMMVMSYTVDGKEYLVLNASAEGSFLPGMAGVRLLADRHQGVGADRVLVFTGTKAEPSLLVYTPEGEAAEAEPVDYKVLVRYLAEKHLAASPAEIAHAFGDRAFVEAFEGGEVARVEFRVTASFVARMREADVRAERLVG